MTVWALMFYGCGEADCYGIASTKELADEWEKADTMYHRAIKYELDKVDWPSWVKRA